jgi:RecA/RadA recombinase
MSFARDSTSSRGACPCTLLTHRCQLRADSATLAVSASSTSDESAAELLSRCYVSPLHLGVPAVDRTTALRPGNVLECVGAAGCGKTRLLLQAAVTCILPETHAGVRYGGNTGAWRGCFFPGTVSFCDAHAPCQVVCSSST